MEVKIYYKKENQNFVETMDIDFVWNETKQAFTEYTEGHSVWKVANDIILKVNTIISFGGKIQKYVFQDNKIAVTIKNKKVDFISTKNISEYILFVLTA